MRLSKGPAGNSLEKRLGTRRKFSFDLISLSEGVHGRRRKAAGVQPRERCAGRRSAVRSCGQMKPSLWWTETLAPSAGRCCAAPPALCYRRSSVAVSTPATARGHVRLQCVTMHQRLSGDNYTFNASCGGAAPWSHRGLFSLRVVLATVTGEKHTALFGA